MSVCLASEGDGSKKKNDRRGRESGLLHGGGLERAASLRGRVEAAADRARPTPILLLSFALVYSSRRRHRLEAGEGDLFHSFVGSRRIDENRAILVLFY